MDRVDILGVILGDVEIWAVPDPSPNYSVLGGNRIQHNFVKGVLPSPL